MEIKSKPEDFIVEEISTIKPSEGMYSYFLLKKRDYGSFKAFNALARNWNINQKAIGYAGIKDKYAITTQMCSVKGVPKTTIENTSMQDIELTYVGQGPKAINLGDLTGNRFTIVIRDADKPNWKLIFKNYYGAQRFAKNNLEIGRLLIKKDYVRVIQLLRETKSDHMNCIEEHLSNNSNDYIGALKKIPPMNLLFYVHTYQSYLWNHLVDMYAATANVDLEKDLPLIGFGYDCDDEFVNELYETQMKKEGITQRDFINKQLTFLSAEGADRKVWIQVKDFEVESLDDKTYKVTFTLPKGCYATEFIRQSFE